jgi:lipopolysaccharide/colanic/teichoic acid biosynthesis glycosyltransferase
MGGVFAGCFENLRERRRRLKKKYKYIPNFVLLYGDFFLYRVFPKLPVFRQISHLITKDSNRVISFAEMLGRLSYCGFEILNMIEINDTLYFVAKKTSLPSPNPEPNYGLVFKMARTGKNGKKIYVYKLRTMHLYSEYLQKFVYDNFSLMEGGKFNDDFRVTEYGRIMRKLWIDELPMFINFFKRELKFIGVRPLSEHYLSLYDPDIREKRLLVKPGLFPPFYADMPKTIEEIQESESRYIDSYLAHPLKTDFTYFGRIVKNILIKHARSN